MRTLLLALTMACGAPTVLADATSELDVVGQLEPGRPPVLQVRITAPSDAGFDISRPSAQGLDLTEVDEPRVERIGDAVVETHRYQVSGPPGQYRVDPGCAAPTGGGEAACATAVWVDLGAPPDRDSMADIVEPSRTWPALPWGWAALAVGALAAAAFGLSRLRRPSAEPVVSEVPEDPAHVVAIRRWEAVRDDPGLTDMEKAQALSEIFRAYVEAALAFPARAWTTTQTLSHLEALPHLPKMNVPRARRLLRATDRVKYAEAQPGAHFFDDLEADLHAFVDQTKPKAWDGDA